MAQHYAAFLHHRRREVVAVLAQADALLTLGTGQELSRPLCLILLAEAVLALAREQGFQRWEAWGISSGGWALVEQGQGAEGDRPDTPGFNRLAGGRTRASTAVLSR